jgi:antagonist of KipI
MGTLRVIRPGLLTTVQDSGRWGHQAEGVPVAGAMDVMAHRLANALAGNHADEATLEVTLTGPELTCDDRRTVAIAGAVFDLELDGTALTSGRAFELQPGSRLRFGARRSGARAYVAVSGGIDVPAVLGSRATHLPTRMGGFHGRALRAGDVVTLGEPAQPAITGRDGQTASQQPSGHPAGESESVVHVRVLPHPQLERFAPDALEVLQSEPYRVQPESNRMGFRLAGPRLRHTQGADVISDAVPLGGVQVPASGEPILLMADRQTTGGYTMIATVITADIGAAAQAAPGDRIAFTVCTPGEALAALIAAERALNARASR